MDTKTTSKMKMIPVMKLKMTQNMKIILRRMTASKIKMTQKMKTISKMKMTQY